MDPGPLTFLVTVFPDSKHRPQSTERKATVFSDSMWCSVPWSWNMPGLSSSLTPPPSVMNWLQRLLAHSTLFESLCHKRIDPASCSQTESRCWSTPLIKSKLCTGHRGQLSQPHKRGNPSFIRKCQWNLVINMCANVDYVYYFSVNINAGKGLDGACRCHGKSESNLGDMAEWWNFSRWLWSVFLELLQVKAQPSLVSWQIEKKEEFL